MGCVNNITYENFPKQNKIGLGARVLVCYHHDTSKTHSGVIVRDDAEEPYETIIQLDNGRFVKGSECHPGT